MFVELCPSKRAYVLAPLQVPFLEWGFCRRDTGATKEGWGRKGGRGEEGVGDCEGPDCKWTLVSVTFRDHPKAAALRDSNSITV